MQVQPEQKKRRKGITVSLTPDKKQQSPAPYAPSPPVTHQFIQQNPIIKLQSSYVKVQEQSSFPKYVRVYPSPQPKNTYVKFNYSNTSREEAFRDSYNLDTQINSLRLDINNKKQYLGIVSHRQPSLETSLVVPIQSYINRDFMHRQQQIQPFNAQNKQSFVIHSNKVETGLEEKRSEVLIHQQLSRAPELYSFKYARESDVQQQKQKPIVEVEKRERIWQPYTSKVNGKEEIMLSSNLKKQEPITPSTNGYHTSQPVIKPRSQFNQKNNRTSIGNSLTISQKQTTTNFLETFKQQNRQTKAYYEKETDKQNNFSLSYNWPRDKDKDKDKEPQDKQNNKQQLELELQKKMIESERKQRLEKLKWAQQKLIEIIKICDFGL